MAPDQASSDDVAEVVPGLVPELIRYKDGVPKMRGFHLDGEMHGEWTWYRTDGSVMRTGRFDRGRQVGTWSTFDRSGRLVKETEFPPGP